MLVGKVREMAQRCGLTGKVPEGAILEFAGLVAGASIERATAPHGSAAPTESAMAYDPGQLDDKGGGDVGWWHFYLRAELSNARNFYQSQRAATPVSGGEWISDVVRDIAELPDRDSPEGQPDMMLVTVNELHDIIERHAPGAAVSAAQAAPVSGGEPMGVEMLSLIETLTDEPDGQEIAEARNALPRLRAAVAASQAAPVGEEAGFHVVYDYSRSIEYKATAREAHAHARALLENGWLDVNVRTLVYKVATPVEQGQSTLTECAVCDGQGCTHYPDGEWQGKCAACKGTGISPAPVGAGVVPEGLRDQIGQAIADYAAEHMNPGGQVGIDWCSANDIDPLADRIVALLPRAATAAHPVAATPADPGPGRKLIRDFEGIAHRFFKNLVQSERRKVLQAFLGWDDKTMDQVRTHSDERRCLKHLLSEWTPPAPLAEVCRNQLLQQGAPAIPKSCPRCGLAKVCPVGANHPVAADDQVHVPDDFVLLHVDATKEIVVAIERAIDAQLNASGISPRDMVRQDGEEIYDAIIDAAIQSRTTAHGGAQGEQ